MSTQPLTASRALAILAAARAALKELPELGAPPTRRAPVTAPSLGPVPAPVPKPGPTAPRILTPGNAAQQTRAPVRTNPRRVAGVTPRQMTAARLLLAGRRVAEVAGELGVHPYTVSRWKRDPLFEAELRRQVERATARNAAQHEPARRQPPARNEPNAR